MDVISERPFINAIDTFVHSLLRKGIFLFIDSKINIQTASRHRSRLGFCMEQPIRLHKKFKSTSMSGCIKVKIHRNFHNLE